MYLKEGIALIIPSPDWSDFDFFTNIFTPSLTNSTSSLVIDTSSDLLKPPEKPTNIKALSLSFLLEFTEDLSICLIIAFMSLNYNGFFAF